MSRMMYDCIPIVNFMLFLPWIFLQPTFFNNKMHLLKNKKGHKIHFILGANSYMYRHQRSVYTLYTLTRDTSHASAWRDPFGPYIVTDVCVHNPENINNCEGVTEEAHYCLVLLLQQYGLHLFGVVTTAIWTALVWCCYYSNMDCTCLVLLLQQYGLYL